MISGLYAALLGVIFLLLTCHVINGRKAYRVALGDGGNPDLAVRIRIQANFAETVPLSLILMMLAEMQGIPLLALHALGLTLIAGRIAHAYGLQRADMRARVAGMLLTQAVIFACCVALLWKFAVHAI